MEQEMAIDMDKAVSGKRVLVVEDNVDSADTMQMLLEISGYEARAAYDGTAAISIAREFEPHAVLLDIGLPRKDGYEVARELRALAQTRSSLLVALTGFGHEDDRQRASEAGFDAYQVKPVDPAALQKLLDAYFRERPGEAP
jgi:DNA-binding response OmpR family regulator